MSVAHATTIIITTQPPNIQAKAPVAPDDLMATAPKSPWHPQILARMGISANNVDRSKICWNVLYTAALLALRPGAPDTTLTAQSQNYMFGPPLPLAEWVMLKGRHGMMLKALHSLGAPQAAVDRYTLMRKAAFKARAQQ